MSDDQQPEFSNLSEFYIIIFLNKLKTVEIAKKLNEKIKTKCLWLWRPFRDLQAPSWLSRLQNNVLAEPPLIGPAGG